MNTCSVLSGITSHAFLVENEGREVGEDRSRSWPAATRCRVFCHRRHRTKTLSLPAKIKRFPTTEASGKSPSETEEAIAAVSRTKTVARMCIGGAAQGSYLFLRFAHGDLR